MPLTTQQKTAVTQFVSFTQADKKTAERVLKTHNWNIQQAVDGYFAHGGSAPSSGTSDRTTSALNSLFDKYRDDPSTPDLLTINATMAYLSDLSLAPDSITVLVLSELLQSPTLGEITRTGFTTGWSAHPSASSITAQKTILKQLTTHLVQPGVNGQTSSLFRRVYKHTFKLALPAGTRGIPLEMASEYWRLLFGDSGACWDGTKAEGRAQGLSKPWLEWWITFLGDKWRKAVNKDLWEQTLVFCEKTRADESLGWWSEDGAWPGVVDEFVGWCKSEKGIDGGGEAMEE